MEWLSYIAGPTISILQGQLDAALAESFVPYAPTKGDYLSAAEAQARYENLEAWYDQ